MSKIAIDGPAGAGKSTIAKAVAGQLGWIYVDTGAMFRTLGLAALRKGICIPKEHDAVTQMLPDTTVRLKFEDGVQKIFLNGEEVSREIRTAEVSRAASDISVIPSVRQELLAMQRKIAAENNVVMDGRDIGTVVLPDAELKIFLTASAEERAGRRCLELQQKGEPCEFSEVLEEIRYRDHQDSTRAEAPLKKAEDAVELDTTSLTPEQAAEAVMKLAQQRF